MANVVDVVDVVMVVVEEEPVAESFVTSTIPVVPTSVETVTMQHKLRHGFMRFESDYSKYIRTSIYLLGLLLYYYY